MSSIKRIELHVTKGQPPEVVKEVNAVTGGGLEGDRHCHDESRQISVTGQDVLDWMESCETPGVCFRKFGANLIFDSIPDEMLKKDLVLKAGSAQLRIESVHKKCHAEECMYFDQIADCRLRKYMFYAGCIQGGVIAENDTVEISGQE